MSLKFSLPHSYTCPNPQLCGMYIRDQDLRHTYANTLIFGFFLCQYAEGWTVLRGLDHVGPGIPMPADAPRTPVPNIILPHSSETICDSDSCCGLYHDPNCPLRSKAGSLGVSAMLYAEKRRLKKSGKC